MSIVHQSKIDAWLAAVLAIAVLVSIWASFALIVAGPASAWWCVLLTVGVGVGLPLWVLFGTHYRIESAQLCIRSGPFEWIVPIADITAITPTRSPLSAPALSLDRLRIEYGHGRAVVVSPSDQAKFMRDIEAHRHAQ